MFRVIVMPIFRSIRLQNTACGMKQATYKVLHNTSCILQYNAPEDGQIIARNMWS